MVSTSHTVECNGNLILDEELVKYLNVNSREPVSRFCSNISMWRQNCFNLARFRSRSSSIFATLKFSLGIFFFFVLVPGITTFYFLSLHNRCTLLRFSLLFSPKHSVFCRQTQLIPHYVMLTVALPGDRTQRAVRRTTSTVVIRQRLCVVVSVLCVCYCSQLQRSTSR